MLVITRKSREWVLAIDRETKGLVAKVAIVKSGHSDSGVCRLGMEFPDSVFVIRQELTELSHLSFDDMAAVPLGTQVRINERARKPA